MRFSWEKALNGRARLQVMNKWESGTSGEQGSEKVKSQADGPQTTITITWQVFQKTTLDETRRSTEDERPQGRNPVTKAHARQKQVQEWPVQS